MPLLGRVVGALTDSRGVGDSSWEGSWVEVSDDRPADE